MHHIILATYVEHVPVSWRSNHVEVSKIWVENILVAKYTQRRGNEAFACFGKVRSAELCLSKRAIKVQYRPANMHIKQDSSHQSSWLLAILIRQMIKFQGRGKILQNLFKIFCMAHNFVIVQTIFNVTQKLGGI